MEAQLHRGGTSDAGFSADGNNIELSLKRGERERQLELMVSALLLVYSFSFR